MNISSLSKADKSGYCDQSQIATKQKIPPTLSHARAAGSIRPPAFLTRTTPSARKTTPNMPRMYFAAIRSSELA